MNKVQQVVDDSSLLTLMLSDNEKADKIFHPSKRWKKYSDLFVQYLYVNGLKDFRRVDSPRGSPGGVLASFGANDINPIDVNYQDLYHQAASSYMGSSGVNLYKLEASQMGNPEGFYIGDKFFTMSWLNFYCRYTYVTKYFSFNDQIVVELGSGSGKQAELLKKAHPELTIVLFDLPTQLYVCNQYLSSVFSDDEIVDYRKARNFKSFDDIQKGKINILPNWLFPILFDRKVDLFWNAASIQEMSLESARKFLDCISEAENLFLMHNVKFQENQNDSFNRGVIDEVSSYGFREVDRTLAVRSLGSDWIYRDSFWVKAN